MFWRKNQQPKPDEILTFLADVAVRGEVNGESARELYDRAPNEFDSCLGAMLQSVAGTGGEALTAVAEHLDLVRKWSLASRSGSERERVDAIRKLGRAFTPEALEALTVALDDQTREVRVAAAVAFLDAGASAYLVEGLRGLSRPAVQRVLVDVLRLDTTASPTAGGMLWELGFAEALRVVARGGGPGSVVARDIIAEGLAASVGLPGESRAENL